VSLKFPSDLDEWRAWQGRRHRLRRIKSQLRPDKPNVHLYSGGTAPSILVVVEGLSSSYRAAFLACLDHLPRSSVAVLAPSGVAGALPTHTGAARGVTEFNESLKVVLAPGHYTELGRIAGDLSHQLDIPFFVAQHGLMTPLAPPLPPDAHLLAWSAADADFWWSSRNGASTVVGSQLLWAAGSSEQHDVDPGARPVYLGQLHGAELPRRGTAAAAEAFCREHGAVYRPHPSEVDRLSRWQHRRWERRGIEIDRSGTALRDLSAPVVSVFSTGVLEAATRGIPAWVDYPDPPAWLQDFWQRYDLRRYGAEPTPAPRLPAVEPAVAVAEVLRSYL
jgi:hypothetical protein